MSANRNIVVLTLVGLLTATTFVAAPHTALASKGRFDDRYVFAATRGVDDMHAHPAVKIALFPVTVAIDTAFLPFAVIAGYVG